MTLHKTIGMAAMLAVLAGPALAQQYPQHPTPVQHQLVQHQAYAPHHGNWHQGDHYNGQRVVVTDWSHHHLHQPPAGYEWVQSGDQFVLIAVSTGIIASIIAGSISQ